MLASPRFSALRSDTYRDLVDVEGIQVLLEAYHYMGFKPCFTGQADYYKLVQDEIRALLADQQSISATVSDIAGRSEPILREATLYK